MLQTPPTQPVLNLDALRNGKLDEAAQRTLLSHALAQHTNHSNTAESLAQVFEIADYLSFMLLNKQRHGEAREIAEHALQLGTDAALLHTLALSEHALGDSKQAMNHLEQALQQLGNANDAESAAMQSDMLEHLALIQQSQNQHLRAIQSLERAAALSLAHHDMDAYIRLKTQLAKATHELGDALQASDHLLDILSVTRAPEAANTLNEHTARTLLQLADLAREGENNELETSLRREALDVLAQAGMVAELAQTLFQIARLQNQRETMWQAIWLMLAITQNVEGLYNAHAWLYMREDQKTDPDSSLLAAAIWATIESLPEDKIPKDLTRFERNKRVVLSQLFTCARIQGIHESEITAWMEHEKLRLSDGVIQTMLHRIENQLESSSWLFNRHALKS
ncbi:MAG: hypothetical protein AB7S56_05650 [Halothiobacillaceae bacterium]